MIKFIGFLARAGLVGGAHAVHGRAGHGPAGPVQWYPGREGLEAGMDSEIRENPDSSLEGKKISRVPDYTANLGAKYTAPGGWGGRINWRKVGEYYVDFYTFRIYGSVNITQDSFSGSAKAAQSLP